jgi:hypothetical protein
MKLTQGPSSDQWLPPKFFTKPNLECNPRLERPGTNLPPGQKFFSSKGRPPSASPTVRPNRRANRAPWWTSDRPCPLGRRKREVPVGFAGQKGEVAVARRCGSENLFPLDFIQMIFGRMTNSDLDRSEIFFKNPQSAAFDCTVLPAPPTDQPFSGPATHWRRAAARIGWC